MLNMISASYKTYGKNFPVILLYALPLLVLSVLEAYFRGSDGNGKGIAYFIALTAFFLPLISAATDIAIYRRLLNTGRVNPFICFKTLFIYMFTQIALGLIFATIPVLLFAYFLGFLFSFHTALVLALVLNIFVGMVYLARFNIILPLIVMNKKITWKTLKTYTDRPYKQWLTVACLVYAPYLLVNYLFCCPISNVVLTNLFMFVFVCFNIVYVTGNKWKEQASAVSARIEPKLHPAEDKTAAVKPVVKAEKKAAVKKVPAAGKSAVKKPSVKSAVKKAPVKKTAAPKKPKA